MNEALGSDAVDELSSGQSLDQTNTPPPRTQQVTSGETASRFRRSGHLLFIHHALIVLDVVNSFRYVAGATDLSRTLVGILDRVAGVLPGHDGLGLVLVPAFFEIAFDCLELFGAVARFRRAAITVRRLVFLERITFVNIRAGRDAKLSRSHVSSVVGGSWPCRAQPRPKRPFPLQSETLHYETLTKPPNRSCCAGLGRVIEIGISRRCPTA